MLGAALVFFLLVPVVELYVMILVGSAIGALPTVAILVALSVLGLWLVKRQGLGLWRRAQNELDRGQLPAREALDGLLVLLAGGLLIIPGFVTDAVALALLLPPVRALVRPMLSRRLERRLSSATVGFAGPSGFRATTRRYAGGQVVDVIEVGDVTPPEWRTRDGSGPDRPPAGELEP